MTAQGAKETVAVLSLVHAGSKMHLFYSYFITSNVYTNRKFWSLSIIAVITPSLAWAQDRRERMGKAPPASSP